MTDLYRRFKKFVEREDDYGFHPSEKDLAILVLAGKSLKILNNVQRCHANEIDDGFFITRIVSEIFNIVNRINRRYHGLFPKITEYMAWLTKKAIKYCPQTTIYILRHSPKCQYILRNNKYDISFDIFVSMQFMHKRRDTFLIHNIHKIQYKLTSTIIEKISLKSIMRLSLYFV